MHQRVQTREFQSGCCSYGLQTRRICSIKYQVQAYVFQRRAGGILLVFPDHVIEEEFLRLHAVPSEEGGEPLVGPFQRFRVPIMLSGEDDVLVLSEELGSVVVMDMNLPGAHSVLMSFPEEGEEVDLINHFAYSDSEARPDFVALSAKVREWISLAEGKERLVFYPAAEEEEGRPSPTAKRAARPKASPGTSTQPGKQGGIPKAGPKKHTVASLAQQLETVLAVLPTITDQLTSLTLRQEAMERGADQQAAPSFQPITTTKTAQPVSALLKGSPTQTLAGLSRQLGPPRVKSVATHPGRQQLQQEAEDEPYYDPLMMEGAPDPGPPMTQAIVQQSRALALLVAQMQATGADPMSDLSSSIPTTGVKGTLARE